MALSMTPQTLSDPRIIVALDVSNRAEAEQLVERLGSFASFYKIGLQLLATEGMAMARDLKARGRSVFADWKLHDIGATVEKASAALAASGACDFLTVHAEPQVLAAAVRGRGEAPMKILGVTVLTSLNGQNLGEIGYSVGVDTLVERRVRQALESGADGVVSSPHEAAIARRVGGADFLVVTPSIRPTSASEDDQVRTATPRYAIENGASHLVVGRPITASRDPCAAIQVIASEIADVVALGDAASSAPAAIVGVSSN